jgi:hypothetical protein
MWRLKKFSLLLLDTNVVIELFAFDLWDRFIEVCDVHLARTVVNESKFWEDDLEQRYPINLAPYEQDGRITVHDADVSELSALTDQFGPTILEKLDPGESESLAILCNSKEQFLISSSDRIAYRVLGALLRSEQGISLEEIMQSIGLTKKLKPQFGKAFREEWSRRGFDEGISGLAFKKPLS